MHPMDPCDPLTRMSPRRTRLMIGMDRPRTARDLLPKIERLFDAVGGEDSGARAALAPADGAPVFTVRGRYQARGWTEWTQGFQFGSALLQFDATGDARVPRARAARGRSSGWRRTSRTSACTITASTTSAPTATCGGSRARAASRPSEWERALLRAGAEGQRRRAGARWTRAARTAASSTRSTARTRCSSTPSDRCARWRSAHRARPAR